MNAHTTPDCLFFYEFGPSPRLESLLAVAIARLASPLAGVTEEAFALERRIVGNESLFREDTHRTAWAANALYPILFPPSHPYARPVGGTEESRRKLTLDLARAYTAKTFRPERMTLLVSAPRRATSLDAITEMLPPALRGDAAHPVARPTQPRPPEAAPRAASNTTASPAAVPVERRIPRCRRPSSGSGGRFPADSASWRRPRRSCPTGSRTTSARSRSCRKSRASATSRSCCNRA